MYAVAKAFPMFLFGLGSLGCCCSGPPAPTRALSPDEQAANADADAKAVILAKAEAEQAQAEAAKAEA